MKRVSLIGWVVVLGVVAAGGGVGYRLWSATGGAKPAAVPTQGPPNVLHFAPGAPQLAYVQTRLVDVAPEPLLEPLNGRIAYNEDFTVRVSSPIAGRVVKLLAETGTTVRVSDALLVLDAPEFAAAVSDAVKADAELRQKELAHQRARELLEAGVTARKEYESVESDFRQAGAERARAHQRLANLRRDGTPSGGDRFMLRAPIAGVVADRHVNPGSEVRPDQVDPLFVITDPTHLWVLIDLPERYLGKINAGKAVEVTVDAYPGQSFRGRIAHIGEVLDPATRRVQVRCVLENPQRLLKPEMFARVTPLADTDLRLTHIPNTALVSQGLYSFVFVETEPGVFQKRQVKLGLQGRDESFVREGLREGERVVVSGALLLNSELAGNGE